MVENTKRSVATSVERSVDDARAIAERSVDDARVKVDDARGVVERSVEKTTRSVTTSVNQVSVQRIIQRIFYRQTEGRVGARLVGVGVGWMGVLCGCDPPSSPNIKG